MQRKLKKVREYVIYITLERIYFAFGEEKRMCFCLYKSGVEDE